jgi:hypothetical protein
MRIVVTEVTGQGNIRRGVLDTARYSDPARCQDLVEQAGLDMPPPYRPEVGRPVYEICVDNQIVWVAWRDLVGPLRELVIMAILADRPAPGRAEGEAQRQRVTPPALGEQVEHDAPGEPAGAQPEDKSARSLDQPEPGDRGEAAMPVPRRDKPGHAGSPDEPVQGVRASGLPNRAPLPASPG